MTTRLETRDDGLYIVSTDAEGKSMEPKKVIRGWESFTGWYWFAVEKVEERKVAEGGGSIIDGREVDDTIWFGYVQGIEEEWGDFSQAEIESLGKMTTWAIKPQDLRHAGRRR